MALVAHTDKLSLLFSSAVYIHLAQRQLRMFAQIVDMMYMVGSRVSAFALAYLALVLVLRQYFPPQLAPLWRYIKLMNVARCYQLADISLCHLSLNFSQRPCAYIIVLHANTSVKCAINLLLSHRSASLSPPQSSATLRPYHLYLIAPAAVQAILPGLYCNAVESMTAHPSLCNCYWGNDRRALFSPRSRHEKSAHPKASALIINRPGTVRIVEKRVGDVPTPAHAPLQSPLRLRLVCEPVFPGRQA